MSQEDLRLSTEMRKEEMSAVNKANLVLDFTHTYSREWLGEVSDLQYLDCSDIPGTDMYCSPEAEEELSRRIAAYPLAGIHFLDSGNYHYLTKLFTRRIKEPYQLLIFDNHTDMQPTMIPGLTSCGAWAAQVLEEDERLEKMVLLGPSQQALGEIGAANREKLFCVSGEELERTYLTKENREFPACLRERLSPDLPLYLSIDKDVLSEEYARTNWDQGNLPLPFLCNILSDICESYSVLGVDICGALPLSSPGREGAARQINEETDRLLLGLFARKGFFEKPFSEKGFS